MQGEVFGGYVRSYGFNYDPNSNVAQGKMWIDFGTEIHVPFDVTVVILGGEPEDAIIAQQIVEKTAKLSELSDLVLDAHFCTFDKSLQQHIVVYERFDVPFFGADRELPPFFMDGHRKDRLTTYWLDNIR
jgi:hypothetical protein